MIYIIEIPHQMPPIVWCRETQAQIMSAIFEGSLKSGEIIYEEATGEVLLDMFGYESTAEMRDDNDVLTSVADLLDTHGLEATFYRGYGHDGYTTEPVDEWAAHLEWNGHDLSAQRVYMSDDEARAALADDTKWNIHQGAAARSALEKILAGYGE